MAKLTYTCTQTRKQTQKQRLPWVSYRSYYSRAPMEQVFLVDQIREHQVSTGCNHYQFHDLICLRRFNTRRFCTRLKRIIKCKNPDHTDGTSGVNSKSDHKRNDHYRIKEVIRGGGGTQMFEKLVIIVSV